jgi:hypothetical protein
MNSRLAQVSASACASFLVLVAAVGAVETGLSGCSFGGGPTERYVSPKVEGASSKINLDEVQKAFFESKGKDLNSWMGAFEKRVNEIYEGKEIVSIDATRHDGRLLVTGYIDTQKKEGFVAGDDKLFSIEQTGEAANNEMPYRLSGQDGQTYYEGHHSLLDNPFLQAMLISHLMGGWGGRYSTPMDRTVVLGNYRDSYRQTPNYVQQTASNRDFATRFKTKAFGGGLQSTNKFGNSSFSSTTGATNRTWGGGTVSGSGAAGTASTWGGRRSTSSFGSFRSSSFGGGRGWGGRRR